MWTTRRTRSSPTVIASYAVNLSVTWRAREEARRVVARLTLENDAYLSSTTRRGGGGGDRPEVVVVSSRPRRMRSRASFAKASGRLSTSNGVQTRRGQSAASADDYRYYKEARTTRDDAERERETGADRRGGASASRRRRRLARARDVDDEFTHRHRVDASRMERERAHERRDSRAVKIGEIPEESNAREREASREARETGRAARRG